MFQKRRNYLIIDIAVAILAILGLRILLKDDEVSINDKPIELIAHGGGSVSGETYTNSLEAFENAVRNGFKYIELDLSLTSDGSLVAAHHFTPPAPSLDQFLNTKIKGKYTPLKGTDIDSLLSVYPHIILVTDKISDTTVLNRYFTYRDRIIVEAFSYAHYVKLKRAGYREVFYSDMATDIHSALIKHLLLHKFFRGEKIEWLSMHYSSFNNKLFSILDVLGCEYNAVIYTINDIATLSKRTLSKVKMIYTDSLMPDEFVVPDI